jgi:hypothetical protein
MKYIIQKTDEDGNKKYFSLENIRWSSDKRLAKTFELEHTAKLTALSIPTAYELEVVEYEQ